MTIILRMVLMSALFVAGCSQDRPVAPAQESTQSQSIATGEHQTMSSIDSSPSRSGDWSEHTIEELQALLGSGTLSSVQLVNYYHARISRFNDAQGEAAGLALNAIQFMNDVALAEAQKLDEERSASGARGLLHGIPVLVKDNYETTGMPTTAGSKLFARHSPDRDAHLVTRLKEAGAIILGKTTMHEFAYGITTVGSNFGQTRNPYDPTRNPGGSSGGSGAAVAANFATVAMGSDTCGSIRIPAAQNNLVGLRGTQGLSSRAGIIPLSATQDIGGPLAKSVADLAIVLDATVGFDEADAQTEVMQSRTVGEYHARLESKSGMRIGVLDDWMVQAPADEAVADVVEKALARLTEKAGWHVSSHTSERLNASLDRTYAGHLVLIRDFYNNINEYLANNPGIGYGNLQALIDADLAHPEVVPSLQASQDLANMDSADYEHEIAQRAVVKREILSIMQEHNLDALAYPTIRRVAAKLGDSQPGTNCRIAANSGLPAISVPAGFTEEGLPVGLELLAEPFSEMKLLNLAYTIEQANPQRKLPPHTPAEKN